MGRHDVRRHVGRLAVVDRGDRADPRDIRPSRDRDKLQLASDNPVRTAAVLDACHEPAGRAGPVA